MAPEQRRLLRLTSIRAGNVAVYDSNCLGRDLPHLPALSDCGSFLSHTKRLPSRQFGATAAILAKSTYRPWHVPCIENSASLMRARLALLSVTTSLARGASDELDTAVALPLTAVSSQNVIGSFEARFFLRWRENFMLRRDAQR